MNQVVRVWLDGQWRHGHLEKEGHKWDYLLIPEGDKKRRRKVLKGDYQILDKEVKL